MVSARPGVGGTYLSMRPEDISLRTIFEAVEMECVKLADLYRDMKERLAAEPDQEW